MSSATLRREEGIRVDTSSTPRLRPLRAPTQAEREFFRSAIEYLRPPTRHEASLMSDGELRERFSSVENMLRGCNAQLFAFIKETLRANVLDEREVRAVDLDSILHDNATRAVRPLPALGIDEPSLAELSASQLFDAGKSRITKLIWQHVFALTALFQYLAGTGIVGSLKSYNSEDSVCSFTGSRIRFNDEVMTETTVHETQTVKERYQTLFTLGTRTVDVTTSTSDTMVKTGIVHEQHTHELVDCYRKPLYEAEDLPKRIRTLRETFLPTLIGTSEILYGTLLRHEQADEELSVHNSRMIQSEETRRIRSTQRDGLTQAGATVANVVAGAALLASLPFAVTIAASNVVKKYPDPALIVGGNHGYVLARWLPEEVMDEQKVERRA